MAAPAALAACQAEPDKPVQAARPVRTVVVAKEKAGEPVLLTGSIQAENEVAFAFRISGRMIERLVNVGDQVKTGQVLARLDPLNEMNNLRAAQAAVAAAQAQLTQAQNAFDRQETLLARGFTTRAQFDLAEKALQTARAQTDSAQAQYKAAQDLVDFTELRADAPGTVTARGAEPGEVVQAGRMIVQVARQDGRDAVFDVPAQLLRAAPSDPDITVALTDDPSVKAVGHVREVAPQADPVTRTFLVKVGLTNPPAAMRLGSTVTGTVRLDAGPTMEIPASALTASNRQPAVWIVDPASLTVSMRNVEVQRHRPSSVAISGGLTPGDIVVTAGVQALHPGQKVRLLGSEL